eukprot:1392601-Prymnesium_polylepis.1
MWLGPPPNLTERAGNLLEANEDCARLQQRTRRAASAPPLAPRPVAARASHVGARRPVSSEWTPSLCFPPTRRLCIPLLPPRGCLPLPSPFDAGAGIVHQCNTVSSKLGGGGLSEQLFRKFPHANVYEAQHARGSRSQPGTASLCGRGVGGSDGRGVVNLMGQRYPGPPKDANGDGTAQRQAWFSQALQALGAHPAIREQHQSLAFPNEVGCGLAGGDWAAYRKMIEAFARAHPEVKVAIVRFGGGGNASKRARRWHEQPG